MTTPIPAPSGLGATLDPRGPAIEGFRAVLVGLADAMDHNWQGTVERADPEYLHDLRVAARRSRAVLANARRVIPDDVLQQARTEFGAMSDLTGPPRDLDVYLLGWASYTDPLGPDAARDLEPVRTHLLEAQDQAYEALATWMRSDEARYRLDAWRGWLTGPLPADLPDRALDPLGPYVARRIQRAQATLLREGRAITPASPDELLHDLRKDAKKLRYLLECFGTLLGPKPRARLVKRLKALQENLGEHQDAAVHATDLHRVAHDLLAAASPGTDTTTDASPDSGVHLADTLLAAGRLLGELEEVRERTRLEFASRFARYDSDVTRQALEDALRRARR